MSLITASHLHYFISDCKDKGSRSQQQRDLRHELFSLARTLGLWVRIPLKAWMFSVCVCVRVRAPLFCVSVVLCLGSSLATG
jgi:hypothetical protein